MFGDALHDWIGTFLAVAAGLWAVFTTLTLYGFRTGKFIQKGDDDINDLDKRHSQLDERVSNIDIALDEVLRSIHMLREEANRDIGKVQLTYELLQQRVEHHKERVEERRQQLDERIRRLEEQIMAAQRLIEFIAGRVRRTDQLEGDR